MLAWQVVEAPAQVHGKPVVLEGSDVLFTGREIFVGIRKNGTNTEGALVSKAESHTSTFSLNSDCSQNFCRLLSNPNPTRWKSAAENPHFHCNQ
jgi:hypothetical protein